jgi:hypothetical protein
MLKTLAMQFREEMGSRMTEVVMDLRTGKATKRVVGGVHTLDTLQQGYRTE